MTRSMSLAFAAALVVVAAGCTPSSTGPDDSATGTPGAPPAVGSSPAAASPGGGAFTEYRDRAEQVAADYANCMIDRGWELERMGERWVDGFTGPGVPEEQLDAYNADVADCEKESGRADLPPPTVSEEEAASLYDLLLDVADCVRGLGYHVPEPPSKQSFVEDLAERPIPSWHPYYDVPDPLRAESACPVPDWP